MITCSIQFSWLSKYKVCTQTTWGLNNWRHTTFNISSITICLVHNKTNNSCNKRFYATFWPLLITSYVMYWKANLVYPLTINIRIKDFCQLTGWALHYSISRKTTQLWHLCKMNDIPHPQNVTFLISFLYLYT